MVSNDIKKQAQVQFSGRVQGVGFRYATCQIAKLFKITGYVKNRSDGDVELVAEGQEQELVNFLHAIRSSRQGRYITQEQLQWVIPTVAYKKFGVSV